ncbi:hypothetical protein ACP4OV_023621 [Aristida adscensionis]
MDFSDFGALEAVSAMALAPGLIVPHVGGYCCSCRHWNTSLITASAKVAGEIRCMAISKPDKMVQRQFA